MLSNLKPDCRQFYANFVVAVNTRLFDETHTPQDLGLDMSGIVFPTMTELRATLILRVLNQLDRRSLSLVKSLILVGNPYRTPGKSSSVDEKGQRDYSDSVGMFTSSALAVNKNAAFPQLPIGIDRSGKVLDYCLAGDGVCSYRPACPCRIPAGHLSYGLVDTVPTTAFEHVVARIGEGDFN
ncbi:hypothetical protein N7491_008897 [Penicillium cf. griseofulvum]|uniref:Uncharacterized protein n=1 Tax=Penicillium cf. griseofulvum TaxID=2972120 RepID=A0A9W9MG15_9EURO|nr:hypothetical protein N7472_005506 [Penicillium cf. griseofulvum]KAJ5423681.1 hypothetical protein N7491_008897 [Penicillium cf. griseofulvum]KAJ5431066.1 hypothetical protein N7445_008798 [Penicillium cf. griseofulvum]